MNMKSSPTKHTFVMFNDIAATVSRNRSAFVGTGYRFFVPKATSLINRRFASLRHARRESLWRHMITSFVFYVFLHRQCIHYLSLCEDYLHLRALLLSFVCVYRLPVGVRRRFSQCSSQCSSRFRTRHGDTVMFSHVRGSRRDEL